MANFDLTPLVKGGGYKVIFRLFLWSVPVSYTHLRAHET
mgnify:CR=1 FL=1